MRETIFHTLEPVFNEHSRVLLLGTMPSPASRREGFYYGHPQNRMWRVLAAVLDEPLPLIPEEKTSLLLRRGVAMWDVLATCTIEGAGDASIRNPLPNELSRILNHAPIEGIFATGQTAGELYRKLCEPVTGRPVVVLPSTSPANCRLSLEHLIEEYAVLLTLLKG